MSVVIRSFWNQPRPEFYTRLPLRLIFHLCELPKSFAQRYRIPKKLSRFHNGSEYAACMAVSVSVLASGSRGNSTVVQSSSTRILVDAGLSCRETFKRMKAAGDDPHSLSAIVITHEHSDHVHGLAVLSRKLGIPVYMTGATHQAWARAVRDATGEMPEIPKLEFFSSGRKFQVGDIDVTPFTIPHDAADPVGFTFRAEGV